MQGRTASVEGKKTQDPVVKGNLLDGDLLEQESERNGSYVSLQCDDIILTDEVPQGRHLGVFSTVNLFVSKIIGAGIFSVPSSIFVNCGGNIMLFLSVWVLATLMAFIGLFLFLEFGSLFPRSGGRKTFLEAIYDKPRMLTCVTFGTYTVMTCFVMSTAIVFGKYTLFSFGYDQDFVNEQSHLSSYIGMIAVIVVVVIHGVSVNHGIFVQNFLGVLKFIIIGIMCVSGLHAIFFYNASDVSNLNFDNFFHFKDASLVSNASLTAAFIQAFYCFAGWESVHCVTSEIKNPNYTLKVAGPLSLLITLFCYTLLNLAYIKVLDFEEIKKAGPLIGSVLFTKLYGENVGRKVVTLSIALSAASNMFVTIYGISRMNQEVFREGYLPFSHTLARNWPFGAPLPSLLVCGLVTTFWLYCLPANGSAFNYLINFEGYGNQILLLLVAVGLLLHRKWYPDVVAHIRASPIGVGFFILFSFYLILGPFFGKQDDNRISVLPPYQVSVLMIFAICLLFWVLKFLILPYVFHYRLVSELCVLEDGLTVKRWIKTKDDLPFT